MTRDKQAVPQGVPRVIPRLFCREPAAELDFCVQVLGAEQRLRRNGSDGKLAHAVVTIGSAMVFIESEWPGITNRAPSLDGSSPVALYVYVADVDAVAASASEAGATVLMPPTDQFWGDRTAWIMDRSGHVWTVATRVEETTEEERQSRLAKLNEE
jgi:PhnB protein